MIVTVDVDQELLRQVRRVYGLGTDEQVVEFALRDALTGLGGPPPGIRRPSQRLRIAAARLRVRTDRAVRRKTPRWILDLADQQSPTPRSMQVRSATERVWREIEVEFRLLTSSEVATAIGLKSNNRLRVLALHQRGDLLGVRRLNSYRYPGFQFEANGTIHPVIRSLVIAMQEGRWSEESFIIWLCSPSRAFADGRRPVDHLDDPNLVSVAEEMMAIDW